MVNNVVAYNNLNSRVAKKAGNSSFAFLFGIIISVQIILYYYSGLEGFLPFDSTFNTYLVLALDVFLLVFLMRKHVLKGTILALILLFLFFILVTSLLTKSCYDTNLQLLFLLFSLAFINSVSLNSVQRGALLLLFLVFVFLILQNTSYGDFIYPNTINPNTGAFLLAISYMIFLSYFSKKSFIYIIPAIVCFVISFRYVSRTALFGMIVFTIIILINKFIPLKTKKWFYILPCLIIVASLIYTYLLPNMLGSDFTIFKKSLFSGRNLIWKLALENDFVHHPVFGVGNHINEAFVEVYNNPLMMNAHNQPLGILITYGVFAFVLFYYLFAKITTVGKPKCGNIESLYLLCIVFMSSFDIYFFSPYNLLPIVFGYLIIKNIRKPIKR